MTFETDPQIERSLPAIDLRMHNGVYQSAGITIYLTWLLTNGEPCIVLLPAGRKVSHERVIPCVIPMITAWMWDEERGEKDHYERNSALFAANLGLDPLSRRDQLKVQSVVRDWLSDLILMPPMPDHLRRKVADMMVEDRETGSITHKEVFSHV